MESDKKNRPMPVLSYKDGNETGESGSIGEEGKLNICSQSAFFPLMSGLSVYKGHFLELGAGLKQDL